MKRIGYLKLVGAECSEGFIIVDLDQSIVWANAAALAMHQVTEVHELGETIDEYHARFQVRYVAVPHQGVESARGAAGDEHGRAQREVLIEVSLPSGPASNAIFRSRKMVLFNEAGQASCIVFIVHKTVAPVRGMDRLSDLVASFCDPAAILRAADGRIVAANAAYLSLSATDATGPSLRRDALFETPLELAGERFRLVHYGSAAGAAASDQRARAESDAVPVRLPYVNVPLLSLDGEMRIADLNQEWLSWLGYTRAAVIGRKIFELMPAPSVERFEHALTMQLSDSNTVRDVPADFVTKDGEIVNAQITLAMAAEGAGEQSLLVLTCIDVTTRKRLEDALSETFALAPVPMLVRKYDGSHIVDVNEAFLKATGYLSADVVGRSFDDFGSFESKKRKDEFDASVRTTGRGGAMEVALKTSDGEKLDCALTATKIWMFGKPCLLIALQDFSERCRTELELMSALEAVMKDGTWFSRSVVERLAAMRAPPKSGRGGAALGDLTPRERDVLSLISLGLPDAEIAERLGLSRSTIRNHLSTLYSKIDVKNRGSAIIWARERCLNVTQLPMPPTGVQTGRVQTGRVQTGLVRSPLAPKRVTPFSHGSRVEPDARVAEAK